MRSLSNCTRLPRMIIRSLRSCSRSARHRGFRTRQSVDSLEPRILLVAPTLDPVSDQTIVEDSGQVTINLTGITAGASENQPIRIIAVTDSPGLLTGITVSYSWPATTGTLRFSPVSNAHGSTSITITVEDGGPDGNLSSAGDNESIDHTFAVTISPVNDPPRFSFGYESNASEDFSRAENPSAEWSYGFKQDLSNAVELLPSSWTYGWFKDVGTGFSNGVRIWKNTSASNSFGIAPGQLALRPGDTASGTPPAVLRWTAPHSADFDVTGSFLTGISTTGKDAYIVVTNEYVWERINFTQDEAFNLSLRLTAGDTVDFIVADQFQSADTPIDVTIRERADIVIAEDYTATFIPIERIDSGANDDPEPMLLSAGSSNPNAVATLLASPIEGATATVSFPAMQAASGSATITVTLTEAGPNGELFQGSFASEILTNQALPLEAFTYCDLNSDGYLDIVTANPLAEPPSITVFLGNGSNSYAMQTPVSPSGFGSSYGITNGDFNSDGLLDIATADSDNNAVWVFLSDGQGGFGTAVIDTRQQGTSRLVSGDINGDGHLDLVALNSTTENISILLGRGDGAFVADSTQSVGAAPAEVVICDVNGDGNDDILTVNRASADVSILLGDGRGRITDHIRLEAQAVEPVNISVEDFNTDGVSDIAVVDFNGNIVVHLGAGGGGFAQPVSYPVPIARPYGIVASDINGDGKVDLIVSQLGDRSVVILEGDSGGVFIAPAQPVIGSTGRIADISVFDAGNDFVPDIVAVTDGGISVFSGSLDSDNVSTSREFDVYINTPPAVDAIPDVAIRQDSGAFSATLSGIHAGAGRSQLLRLSATSSNTSLLPNPTSSYTSGDSSGSLSFSPVGGLNGISLITVVVEDAGDDGDFETLFDNATFTTTFSVTVNPIVPSIIAPGGTTESQRPRLGWTAIPDAQSYEVWIGNSSTGENPYFRQSGITDEFLDIPVDLGVGKMDLWVRAIASDGPLGWSSMHRFNVITAPVVDAMDVRQETARPEITWPAVVGATGYDVWVNNFSTGESQLFRESLTEALWRPSVDLDMGRYRLWVRAEGPSGFRGGWSVRTSFYTVPAPEVISPVQPTFNRTPTFDFGDVQGATSYQVFVRYLVDGSIVGNVAGLATSDWTPGTDLAPGRYAWWAIADSTVAGFRSAWTPRQEFYIGGLTSITSPVSPAPSTTPLIEWQAVTGVERYVLQVNGDVEGARFIYETNLTTNSFQVVTSFVSGRTYRAWVQAISTTGEAGPWSSMYVFEVASSDGDVDLDEQVAGLGVPELMLTQLAPRENSDQVVAIPAKINFAHAEPDVREESPNGSEDELQRLFEHAVEFGWFEELAEFANI